MVVVLLITGLLVAAVWWYFKLRGLRLARAYTYLMILKRDGSTEASSNRIAISVDMYAANQLKTTSLRHVVTEYKGSRSALIAEAKSKGFRG